MEMKTKVYLAILSIIFFTSCNKEIEFTSVQNQTYYSYRIGDTLAFEKNDTDTVILVVETMEHKFEKDKSWGTPRTYETGRIGLNTIDGSAVGYIIISGLYNDMMYTVLNVSGDGYFKTNNMILGDFEFNNVYYAAFQEDTVWFTPKNKILKMNNTDNDVYERIF